MQNLFMRLLFSLLLIICITETHGYYFPQDDANFQDAEALDQQSSNRPVPQVDFYKGSCPSVEPIVRRTMADHFRKSRLIAAAILRLFFHDCFVMGCDASILLDRSPDGTPPEKESLANNNSITGFRVIDDAKRRLEDVCPGVVSCADVLALAARDAVRMSGGPYWKVPMGRLDGLVSLASAADNDIPFTTMTVSDLRNAFVAKGLDTTDVVTLSGAHTIGRAHCFAFDDRLYNFSNTGLPDPTLDPDYLGSLQRTCPHNTTKAISVALDRDSQLLFDNSYYKELLQNNGLLQTDQELLFDASTMGLVRTFATDTDAFYHQFVKSMVKLSMIGLKNPSEGEIRKHCRHVNRPKSV